MRFKNILKVLAFGVSIGFIFGLVSAIQLISSHKYFHYRMFRLILFYLTERINVGIIYGLIITILFILLLLIISFIWRKLFSPFFEVRITKIKKLTPLAKGFAFSLIFAYLAFFILKFALSPEHNTNFLLVHSLVVLCLFLIFLQIEKEGFQLANSKIYKFARLFGIKFVAVVVVSIFILINLFSLSQKLFNPPSGPNVLLIVADTLRADHLGCYGYKRPTSPYIDKFAAEAIVFEKAMSNAPWTKPSMGTLFTSLSPHEHQAFYWEDYLDNGYLTLAETYRNNNYLTFAVQTNAIITKYYNFHQGFQRYDEIIRKKADQVTALFYSWLNKNKNKPFFAYLHFMDVHLPYEAPEEFNQIFEQEPIDSLLNDINGAYEVRILNELGLSQQDKQHFINMYDAEIRYFDHYFGALINNLKKLGLFDKTIIILTSDHGEEFWEHNGSEHGHSLYKELIHIPLIIKYSSKLPAKRIKSHVQLLNLFPTLLSLSRLKSNLDVKERNLILNVKNDAQNREEIFFEGIGFGAEKKGVLKDGWKLIENTGEKNIESLDLFGALTKYLCPEYKKGFELYNINQDFFEKHNVINEYPQIANRLKVYLQLFKAPPSYYPKRIRTDLKKKLEHLKSLGYVK